MLIICPNCQTSYEVSAASLGADGRTVRCVRCKQTWFAVPPAEPSFETAAAVSAALATARYQQGTAAGDEEPSAEAVPDDPPPDESEVDANLAARAADRGHATFDAPPSLAEALASFEAPPLAPAGDEPAAQPPTHKDPNDVESIAARRARRQKYNPPPREIRPGLTLLLVLLIAANGAILGWRYDIVRAMPQTARLFAAIGLPVNLRGVDFTGVTTTKETHEGVTVLVVNGTIANDTREPHEVPRLRFALKGAAGNEVYTWTTLPGRGSLGAGESEPFSTRLASPPADGREVVVRFFTRRDIAAGGH